MDMELVVSILTGLSVAIPMLVALIVYVKKSIEAKNWTNLLALLRELIEEAEVLFKDGASKKQWVMQAVEASMKTINYPVDMEIVSKLIDDLISMTKKVNVTVEAEA